MPHSQSATAGRPRAPFNAMRRPVRPTLALAVLLAALAAARTRAADAAWLPHTARGAQENDLIGFYELHPDAGLVGDASACPANMTTNTFVFEPGTAPVPPGRFNMKIEHRNTRLADRQCESAGTVLATTHNHPFVTDAAAALRTWATGTGSKRVAWVTDRTLADLGKWPWALGVDYDQRSCRGLVLPGGAAFLWFRPRVAIFLGELQLSGSQKYLAISFGARPAAACLYVARSVGGQDEFPTGPVSDPSNPTAAQAAQTQAPGEGDGAEAPSSATTTTSATTASEQPTQPPQPSQSPQPSQPAQPTQPVGAPPPDPVLNDPGEVFGPSPGAASSSSDGGNGDGDEVDDDGAECFAGSARVALADGGSVRMDALRAGTLVRTAGGGSAPVLLFSHRAVATRAQFVNVTVGERHSVLLTPGHYVHSGTDGDSEATLVAAGSLRVGDAVRLGGADGGKVGRVTDVRRVVDMGLLAPHTAHGSLVVDGLVVSCYTTALHPAVAHALVVRAGALAARLRAAWVVDRALAHGLAPRLARLLPRGPVRVGGRW